MILNVDKYSTKYRTLQKLIYFIKLNIMIDV